MQEKNKKVSPNEAPSEHSDIKILLKHEERPIVLCQPKF